MTHRAIAQQLEAVAKDITAAKQILQEAPFDQKRAVLKYLTQLQMKELLLMERQQLGPPYPFKEVLERTFPHWKVAATSTSTHEQSSKACTLKCWDLEPVGSHIVSYVRQRCGGLLYEKALPEGTQEILLNEVACNGEFWRVYGSTAARIVSKILNRWIVCLQNHPTDNWCGVPDFHFQSADGSEVILVGEGQTPAVMLSAATIINIDNCTQMPRRCVQQACDYMVRRNRRYGFLTFLNGTMCIKRLGDWEFAVSDALMPTSKSPTVLEMLTYMLLKQVEEGPWVPQNPELLRAEGVMLDAELPPQDQVSQQLTNKQPKAHVRRSRRIKLEGFEMELFEDVLGHGQSGQVLEGRVHGKRVAVKAADVFDQALQVAQLQHELEILAHLAPLQGMCVPQVVESGLVRGMDVFFMATGLVEGEHPGWRMAPSCKGSAWPAAREALALIHSSGVLHGDISEENVLVYQERGVWKACILDFGLSTFSDDRAMQAEEMSELKLLFGDMEDSGIQGTSDIGGGQRHSLVTPASQDGTQGIARRPHDSSSNLREALPTGAPHLGGIQIDTTSRSSRPHETHKSVHDLSLGTRLSRRRIRRPTQRSHARASAPVSRLGKGCFNVF